MATATLPEEEVVTEMQPPYNVILHNDDDHSFPYVILMLQKLFGYTAEKGHKLAHEVDDKGLAVVKTCSKELAELKQEQVHSFGPDKTIPRCKGSMTCTIEPAN